MSIENNNIKSSFLDLKHPASLSSASKLSKALQISRKEIQRELNLIPQNYLYKKVIKPKQSRKVVVHFPFYQFTADLIDLRRLSKHKKGFQYILTCVDCLSRVLYCEPLKNESGQSVLEPFKISRTKKLEKIPRYLFSDKDSAFLAASVQAFFQTKGIILFHSFSRVHSGIIEQINRTLMGKIAKYLDLRETLTYVLKDLVALYKNIYHRTIKMTPNQVDRTNCHIVWANIYADTKL